METQTQTAPTANTAPPMAPPEDTEVKAETTETAKETETEKVEAVDPKAIRVYHLNTLHAVLSQRTRNGSSIKDIRTMVSLLKNIQSMIPAEIPAPENPADNATDEQKAEHKKEFDKWLQARQALVDSVVEPKFTPQETAIIKRRLSTFPGFADDPQAGDRILVLAEYFGI